MSCPVFALVPARAERKTSLVPRITRPCTFKQASLHICSFSLSSLFPSNPDLTIVLAQDLLFLVFCLIHTYLVAREL